jgi:hypothetical protein
MGGPRRRRGTRVADPEKLLENPFSNTYSGLYN